MQCLKQKIKKCLFLNRLFSKSANLYENRKLWRLNEKNPFLELPEVWVSNLSQIQDFKQSIISLHPDIFHVLPRLDLLHRNITWQINYQKFQLTKQLTRGEMPGGGAKPWPQKKTGRHHAGSIRAPGWIQSGFAHGIRGPKTLFYMLPDTIRINGLCTALTIKHIQDDLVVINDFSTLIESDAQFLHDLADRRNWGYSVLFVDIDAKTISSNLLKATKNILTFNVMPLYGLNCFSIMKHETLILSLRALTALEQKILNFLHKTGSRNKKYRYIDFKQNFLIENFSKKNEIYSLI